MVSIAVDGPSGAGKSTLSRRIAKILGFVYVDTGAMYRAVGLAAMRRGLPTGQAAAIEAMLPELTVGLRFEPGGQRVLLDGEDVTEEIRGEGVGMAASDVSAHPAVRAFLLDTQRGLAAENNVVMDGRDIGTVVLPNARIKIFLTAAAEDRARRRFIELTEKGRPANYGAVLKDVQTRDYNDSHRAAAPLMQAPDAVLLDTTGNAFDTSFEQMMDIILPRLTGGEGAR